ncbi:patatin-like phospholipase family protein [Svornostia abyssi]|uniref:Patatin-like phospholipase family protein n=1 Tax=Svornostia abyssi TaxID=2898438 RepID=A0ABY5PKJ3_9ACTN|nr:patatin-like phospholipase family protein [Parviterribacteraceae bacterium J379]
MAIDRNGTAPKVALVLPGGGARGAYEAGALSVLLPALEARGERVSVICGTSVGAINAAAAASMVHRPMDEQVEYSLDHWRNLRKTDVISPVLGPGLAVSAARGLAEALGVPGVRLASLLDPRPMASSLEKWIDWMALHRNVRNGTLDAVCVVATSLSTGRPTAFVETRGPAPRNKSTDGIRFQKVTLSGQHVRASAAMPLLFPPVEVTRPARAAGHYIDGATRLNTPLAPALSLGADRVIVIGFKPFAAPPEEELARRPRMTDVLANVLDGLMVDQIADDLHQLAAINSFFADSVGGVSSSARAYRTARGRPSYRKVSYALVAPEKRTTLADVAERILDEKYGGLKALRDPDFPLLSRLLDGGRRGELMSFVLFDQDFAAALIEVGKADAQRWLDRHPRFWCADAAHDLDFDDTGTELMREEHAIDEWRELRRR